jgi:hypothetical protein
MSNQPTVSDIFRRALELRSANRNGSYADLKTQLINDFSSGPVPQTAFLTIQNDDWKDVIHGIIISLEQIENYVIQSGREDDPDKEWRNRHRSIAEAEEKVMEKWMPEELMDMAKRRAQTKS